MGKVNRRAIILGLASALRGRLLSGANTCRDVTLKFRNATRDEIRLIRFEYLEARRNEWHLENVFGLSGEQRLEPGKTWDASHSFERVGGDSGTRFRVTYKRRRRGGSWSSNRTATVGPFTCNDRMTRSLVLIE